MKTYLLEKRYNNKGCLKKGGRHARFRKSKKVEVGFQR